MHLVVDVTFELGIGLARGEVRVDHHEEVTAGLGQSSRPGGVGQQLLALRVGEPQLHVTGAHRGVEHVGDRRELLGLELEEPVEDLLGELDEELLARVVQGSLELDLVEHALIEALLGNGLVVAGHLDGAEHADQLGHHMLGDGEHGIDVTAALAPEHLPGLGGARGEVGPPVDVRETPPAG